MNREQSLTEGFILIVESLEQYHSKHSKAKETLLSIGNIVDQMGKQLEKGQNDDTGGKETFSTGIQTA